MKYTLISQPIHICAFPLEKNIMNIECKANKTKETNKQTTYLARTITPTSSIQFQLTKCKIVQIVVGKKTSRPDTNLSH